MDYDNIQRQANERAEMVMERLEREYGIADDDDIYDPRQEYE